MRIVRDHMSLDELKRLAGSRFGDMVKVVVDVERQIMAVDAGMHADEEAGLLDDGSALAHLRGINLYPGQCGSPEWLEINLRPGQGNRTRSVDDPAVRARIVNVIQRLVVA